MKTKISIILMMLLCSASLTAQDAMRIHYKDGRVQDIPIEQIDSVNFVNGDDARADSVGSADITGCWLWASQEQGYYELLTINEDHTYTGYDNYFTYGFDTMTYGWWGQLGAMLTLRSNGYGYQQRYTWYLTRLTENALGVMTRMGPFTYYKLQPETLYLHQGSELGCSEGDSYVFADGVTAIIRDNRLVGASVGTTYVQKYIAASDDVLSYKVIVE